MYWIEYENFDIWVLIDKQMQMTFKQHLLHRNKISLDFIGSCQVLQRFLNNVNKKIRKRKSCHNNKLHNSAMRIINKALFIWKYLVLFCQNFGVTQIYLNSDLNTPFEKFVAYQKI